MADLVLQILSYVAPLIGACIETLEAYRKYWALVVAPCIGACIENKVPITGRIVFSDLYKIRVLK